MQVLHFTLTLTLAVLGPILALGYLKPILLRVLRSQCGGAADGADFWVRSAYVLAICGTLLLALSFGQYRHAATLDALERALWLVAAGTFGTVAFIARQVWRPLRESLSRRATQPAVASERA